MTRAVQRRAGLAQIRRSAVPVATRPETPAAASAASSPDSAPGAPRPAAKMRTAERTKPAEAVAKAGHMPSARSRSTM